MPNLHRFMIAKAVLEKLPEPELSILLGGGKLLNEINIGTKYLTFCMNAVHASKDGPDKAAAFTSLLFFLRVLAGHVFEAHEYFRKVIRVDELKKTTNSRFLDADFYADIETLKKYFGRTNIISQMRKTSSFHTDAALLRESFEGISTEFTYEILLGQQYQGHNIFYGSEMTMIDGIRHLKPNTNWEEAINSAFEDTTNIAIVMSNVFQQIVGSILAGLAITMDDAEIVNTADGPSIDTVLIPFYCQPPIGR